MILIDDFDLFKKIEKSSLKDHELGPGKYWKLKNKVIKKSILKYGIKDFRGSTNYIGTSYADNFYTDVRTFLVLFPLNILRLLLSIPPLNIIFNKQVNLSKQYLQSKIDFQASYINNNQDLIKCIDEYTMNNTNLGGASDVKKIGDREISLSYLRYLDIHLGFKKSLDFKKIRSVVEVGGGYGAYQHFLIENYPNIRKILFIDVFPILYVGSQYLKTLYGDSVKSPIDEKKINFKEDDSLEIVCISPNQFELVDEKFDLFLNCNSFQEMTENSIKGYRNIYKNKTNENSQIGLVGYSNYDETSQFSPSHVANIFNQDLITYDENSIFDLTLCHTFSTLPLKK